MDKVKESPTFCVLPWMQVATNPAGQFRVCCHSLSRVGLIRNEQGRVLRLDRDAVKDVWNAPAYKVLRRQMASGERPEMCRRCFREEDAGLVSHRQRMNRSHFERTQPQMNAEGEAPLVIRHFDLRLGNLCNLRCRMCNPFSSSQWIKEWEQVVAPLPPEGLRHLEKTTEWPKNPRAWELLEPLLDTLEEIYFTGGEPMLIKQHMTLLRRCVERGLSEKIALRYNTNLTYIPEELTELWMRFQRVDLNCSIDGFGELNDYIRFPSEWAVIDSNFRRILALRAVNPRFQIEVHATVQMYNVLHLTPLFDYLAEFDLFPYLNILDHPEQLNVRVLPEDLKRVAIDRLQPFLERPKVGDLMSYLREDWSHLMPQFVRFTNDLDRLRGQELARLVPELRQKTEAVSRSAAHPASPTSSPA